MDTGGVVQKITVGSLEQRLGPEILALIADQPWVMFARFVEQGGAR